MKKNIFIIFLIIFLFFIYIILCINSYVSAVSSDISASVFRLHIIANSDSERDQNLKYIVRDKIIQHLNSIIDVKNATKENVIEIITQNLDVFKDIAQKTIYENGYNYDVTVQIGNFYFPTKYYGDISLPSGYYDAIRIEIGNSAGQNWWCVMFPPLCFIDVTSGVVPEDSKNTLSDTLSTEEFNLISADSQDMKFKFKLVEVFEDFKNFIAQN